MTENSFKIMNKIIHGNKPMTDAERIALLLNMKEHVAEDYLSKLSDSKIEKLHCVFNKMQKSTTANFADVDEIAKIIKYDNKNTNFMGVSGKKSNDYDKFELIEGILKACGFSGFTDYKTMVCLKNIKKVNKDGKFLTKINDMLVLKNMEKLSTIDALFTFIRNNLIELCVPYEMIHKNSGNYLKLVDKKVTLNDYLINKQIKKNLEFVPSNKYKDYDEFIQKNNNIYRSVNINNSIIDDLIKKCSMTKGTTGIIRKKIITNDCFIIYESCGKYYAQYEIRKSIDIVRNISCKLSEDGIIIGDLNYEITISDDNRIFDKSNDIVLLTMQYNIVYINIEIPEEVCYEFIENNGNYCKSVYIEYDEIVIDSAQRTELANVKKYKYGYLNDAGILMLNDVKILPIEYILFSSDGIIRLPKGSYSEIKFIDIKNKKSKYPVIIKTDDGIKYELIEHDIVNVGDYKSIKIKTKKSQKLEYKYEPYHKKSIGDEISIIINNSKSKKSFRLDYIDEKTVMIDTITNTYIKK